MASSDLSGYVHSLELSVLCVLSAEGESHFRDPVKSAVCTVISSFLVILPIIYSND